MAQFIQNTLDMIDGAIEGYAETVFADFGDPVARTLQLAGVVSLGFIALNTMVQWVPMRVTEYTKWGLRYVIVVAVATSWQQFQPFYDMLTNTPGAIGAALLDATAAPNLNVALDQMVTRIFQWSDHASQQSGWFSISLTAVLLMVVGALMACVAIIVSAIAKIGLAMAVSLAPVFIGTLLFRGTSDLFTHWSRFTIGFALIPLVLAGVMGAVIGVGEALMLQTANEPTSMSEIAGFLIIALAAIIMMSQVPTMVNGLAGTIVATASGIREAQRVGQASAQLAMATARETHFRAVQARSAAGAAMDAKRQGAEGPSLMQVAMNDFLRHRAAGRENMDRYEARQARLGHVARRPEKREAKRAGTLQSIRDATAERRSGSSPKDNQPASQSGPKQERGYDVAAMRALQDRITAERAAQNRKDRAAAATMTTGAPKASEPRPPQTKAPAPASKED